MFLDPEPRTSRQTRSQSDLKSAQSTNATPADQRIVRRPLQEKTSNGTIKQRRQAEEQETPLKPTVRLVRQSPSVASIKKEIFGEAGEAERRRARHKVHDFDHAKLSKEGLETGFRVSEVTSPTNESSDADASIDDSWQASDVDVNDLPSWKRASFSSSNLSDATTLKGSSVAGFSYNHSTHSRSTRISSGTTLREALDSSVLYETDLDDLPESASEAGPSAQASPSVTDFPVPDTPLRASIRTVQSSDGSEEHASEHTATPKQASRRNSWSSPTSAVQELTSSPPQHTDLPSSSSPSPAAPFVPAIPPRLSSKHASSASFGSGSVRRKSVDLLSSSPSSLHRDSSPVASSSRHITSSDPIFDQDTLDSPAFPALTSSPNFLAYSSSPTRPRSRSHPLRGELSYESITSRLQDNAARPDLNKKESWASLYRSSSFESIPSIHVPRRRLRQVRGSLSLDATRRSQMTGEEMAAEVASYRPFDHGSFANSHLHGPAYAAENSLYLRSGDWPSYNTHARQSRSFESYVGDSSSEDEPGDMTMNTFREQSAKPAPLFRPRATTDTSDSLNKRYNGPLPPLPPEPAHDEEHLDMLAELTKPTLRPQRSGYSLRHQRSSSTPVHSRQVSVISRDESERWSTGSNIFPTWAMHFYAGNVALASMSMLSLSSMPSPPTREGAQNGMRFERRSSLRGQRMLTGPQSSAPSSIVTRSPGSSHILPAIFRPRVRPIRKSIGAVRDLMRPHDQKAITRKPVDIAKRDSLTIEPAPATGLSDDSHLPSGQPRYGELRDSTDAPPRPLPRAYSKQKHWNKMSFPRPMSKDRMSEFGPIPHLAPTKRSSSQLDQWRPPSFVESIDLIFKSRGHRQILFFLLGFLCPLIWMVGAVMPLPERPVGAFNTEKITPQWLDDNTDMHLSQHEAGEAAARWREEKAWRQGVWWRNVNRVMSVLGLLIIGAVIAVAIVATR